mgnify:CR=1 FL=1|jgi:hypothetical protein
MTKPRRHRLFWLTLATLAAGLIAWAVWVLLYTPKGIPP